MALIHCPECEKEMSDKVTSCPHCGYPMLYSKTIQPQQVEITAININKSKFIKKTIITTIIISIFIFILYSMISKSIANEYTSNLNSAKNLMLNGGGKAETLCNLTAKVWWNVIYEESDYQTDKYTKMDGSNEFETDFNTALSNLYGDEDTQTIISIIEENQDDVQYLIKELQNPPKSFDNVYDTIMDLYISYKKLTDLAINPTGSLTSFRESKNSASNYFMEYYEKLKAQIPN